MSVKFWGNKRYHSLNYELQKTFGGKVIKLSLDGGFSCPNRDGTIGNKGCLFCSRQGSGEFTSSRLLSITRQLEAQKEFLKTKWKTGKFIAYFQNFTNTYAPLEVLSDKYYEALSYPGVVGLAVATRPDCLPEGVLDLLTELSKKTYLWVELGLQTIHEKTAKFIRRGYNLSCFEQAVKALHNRGIKTVAHLIAGLPNENAEDFLKSVRFLARYRVFGVKLHMLHILKDSDLYKIHEKNPFSLLTQEEYIDLISTALEYLPPQTVIHRLTGDGARETLIAPNWTRNKLAVLSGIDRRLKEKGGCQGSRFL